MKIVDKNVAARGGFEAWRAVQTTTITGKLAAGGNQHKVRFELEFNKETVIQGFNGVQGWKLRPYRNRKEVEPFSPEEKNIASKRGQLDGS